MPGTAITFTDPTLVQGSNIYRIRIELNGGRIIYSQPETVYYLGDAEYILYPNPVLQGQTLNILMKDQVDEVRMQILNAVGQKIREHILPDSRSQVQLGTISKGIYFCRFIKQNGQVQVIPIVIQ